MSGRRANGEGSIYRRKDGRWEGAAFVLGPAGKTVRRRVYGRTRQEAHEKLTALIRHSQQGIPAASSLTVAAYLKAWLTEVAAHKVRGSTYRSYEMYVRRHLVPGLGRRRLARLAASDVRTFLHAKRGEGLSAATVRQLHAILRSALQHAVREDLVPRNVARLVQVPTGTRHEVKPLDVAEARKLLDAAKDDRLFALWAVALAVGLRRGEALGLRWLDIDLDDGVLRVRQAVQRTNGRLEFVPPKTDRSRRTIPLPAVTVEALRGQRTRQDAERQEAGARWREHGLVFTTTIGTPIEPRNLNRSFTVLCRRAGIRPIRLHDLRHTCASLLLAQGVSPRVVMETLGHSAIAVTMNTYAHVMPALQRDAATRMNDVLGA